MNRQHLFLFCGGPSINGDGCPKPLMKIRDNTSLVAYFLLHLQHTLPALPSAITLLCDDGQEDLLRAAVADPGCPVPVSVMACGNSSGTLEKLERALGQCADATQIVQFGYPDIFYFGEPAQPDVDKLASGETVCISAAALTSRFPRLIVDPYNETVRGISNYTGEVPANPLLVFGGDLWGQAGTLATLLTAFRHETSLPQPTLEYDFFFWLINHKKMLSLMLHGDRIWVDSARDIRNLLNRTDYRS